MTVISWAVYIVNIEIDGRLVEPGLDGIARIYEVIGTNGVHVLSLSNGRYDEPENKFKIEANTEKKLRRALLLLT